MRAKKRGIALIINNIVFPKRMQPYSEISKIARLGGGKDADNLNDLLQKLGFEVFIRTDVASFVTFQIILV